LTAAIYRDISHLLGNVNTRETIAREFPKSRFTAQHWLRPGFARGVRSVFTCRSAFQFLCRLLAGSEGTLAFLTEITLACEPLPPSESALVCVHCATIEEALQANLVALRYAPRSCELIDHHILECTKTNLEQRQNRFFVQGDPGALLAVEFAGNTRGEVAGAARRLEAELSAANLGYHYPTVWGKDQQRVWNLRKAALGLLSNIPGDAKPVAVIEDTAVDPEDLPEFCA